MVSLARVCLGTRMRSGSWGKVMPCSGMDGSTYSLMVRSSLRMGGSDCSLVLVLTVARGF